MSKYLLKNKKIWVAGHNGMVGKALVKRLKNENCSLLTVDKIKLDLTNQNDTSNWIKTNKPDVIIIAAARVGGIIANVESPADFLYQNLMIQTNIMHSAKNNDLDKLIFLGSSCIYPKHASQPILESELMKGPLEPTNEAYAIAKIAGLKMCEYYRDQYKKNFISVMPTNLYGPNDDFNISTSHVMGALINKIVNAKIQNIQEVEIYGTGKPRREFLHVDDLADAIIYLCKNYSDKNHINIGTSLDISITELAKKIALLVKWDGEFKYNTQKPDGTLLKKLNIDKLNKLGWSAKINLKDGLVDAINYYITSNQLNLQLVSND